MRDENNVKFYHSPLPNKSTILYSVDTFRKFTELKEVMLTKFVNCQGSQWCIRALQIGLTLATDLCDTKKLVKKRSLTF